MVHSECSFLFELLLIVGFDQAHGFQKWSIAVGSDQKLLSEEMEEAAGGSQ